MNNFRDIKGMQFPTVEDILKKNPHAFEEMAESLANTFEKFDKAERDAVRGYLKENSIEVLLSKLDSWLSDDTLTNYFGEHVCSQDSDNEYLALYHILSLNLDEDRYIGIKINEHYYYAYMDYGMGVYVYFLKPASDLNRFLDINHELLSKYVNWYDAGYKHGYAQGYNIEEANLDHLNEQQKEEYKEGELQGSMEYWAEIDSMDDESI